MNQDYYTTTNNDQKPNSRPSSVAMTDAELEATKRRRLVESAPVSTNSSSSSNNMFRPTAWQSALLQKQLSNFNFFAPSSTSSSTPSNNNSPDMRRSQSSSTVSSVKSESPTPISSMTNLHIGTPSTTSTEQQQQQQQMTKSRQDLYLDQIRLREEYRKRQLEALAQAKEAERIKIESNKKLLDEQQATMRRKMELERQRQTENDDDDIIIDEEMTNRNVCIGMVTTDIVPEKSPLILIRDDQYEIVSLESEGKLNTDNYSFRVTSRSLPPRFYGWILFKDTNILGPLVDERLIWWDAVIPRGKATNTRTPLCIILYCRPDQLGRVASHFELRRLYLKTPPFYNPACRYNNPHQHILERMHQQQMQHYRSNYAGYQYQPQSSFNHRYRQEDGERQSKKDIEMLLSSIPSDVPQILLKKKKKQRLGEQKREERRKKKLNADVIEILDDDEEEEEESNDDSAEEEPEEEEESGYVEGLDIHLMDHQIKGVSWMIDRENNQSSNGGILADDMGLGKTIQTIALMASTMTSEDTAAPSLPKSADNLDKMEAREEEYKGRKVTLIVAPLALIHQWVDEIESKTEPGKLRVLKHHGPNRTKNPAVFKMYDVVVTTYQVVASDMPGTNKKSKKKKKEDDFTVDDEEEEEEDTDYEEEARKSGSTSTNSSRNNSPFPSQFTLLKKDHGPLFQMKWYRVVLDEAQFIKNRLTKASISCATLDSMKRWCLTGTPIQNNIDELYSLLRFLRIQPLSEYTTFKKTISIPMQNGDHGIAMCRLKAVLMAVMLRRTKSVLSTTEATAAANISSCMKKEQEDELMTRVGTDGTNTPTEEKTETLSKKLSLQLPTRTKQDVLLQFSDHEKGLYDILSRKTKDTIQSMVGKQNGYMNILCLLLRLRQACDHPQLVLKSIDNDKDVLDIVSSDANTTNTNHWSSSQRICELCGRSNTTQENESSPYCIDCTNIIKSAAATSSSSTTTTTSPADENNANNKNSTKINKIIDILKETREKNPGEKTIIFSQFTSMLDLMEKTLNQEGFKFCRYDGSMSSQLRERSLTTLKYDSKCTVMLISLKCGSLGLNLTAANRVILVDIWWNPAVEEQAIDRVHRIGQRLPVHVTRLLIDKTVELKIIKLQEKKAQLSKGALGDGLVKSAKLTASEIRSLFDL